MKRTPLSLPELEIIAGTRVALGLGAGLLLAGLVEDRTRRAAGWSLLAIGAASTVPILMQVKSSLREMPELDEHSGASRFASRRTSP
jgi:hypothetical protein